MEVQVSSLNLQSLRGLHTRESNTSFDRSASSVQSSCKNDCKKLKCSHLAACIHAFAVEFWYSSVGHVIVAIFTVSGRAHRPSAPSRNVAPAETIRKRVWENSSMRLLKHVVANEEKRM
jgi:hypothetical protein